MSQDKIRIVYDVDDVLNNLSEYVHQHVGADQTKQDNFVIEKCSHLDDFQKRQIVRLFNVPSVWYNLQWADGATSIGMFNTEVSEVFINSNNFSQRVADVKAYMLLRDIPYIDRSHINMQIIDLLQPAKKRAFPNTTIIVEDNFEAINCYHDAEVRLLIDKPYNKAESFGTTDEDCGITRVMSLIQANMHIMKYITRLYSEMMDRWE